MSIRAVAAQQPYCVHALGAAVGGGVEQPLRAVEPQPQGGGVRTDAQTGETSPNAVKYELLWILFKQTLLGQRGTERQHSHCKVVQAARCSLKHLVQAAVQRGGNSCFAPERTTLLQNASGFLTQAQLVQAHGKRSVDALMERPPLRKLGHVMLQKNLTAFAFCFVGASLVAHIVGKIDGSLVHEIERVRLLQQVHLALDRIVGKRNCKVR